MKETDIQIQWHDGNGESVEIGYFNPNGQQCCGHCGVQGTDHVKGSIPLLTCLNGDDSQEALCHDHFESNIPMHGTMS